MPNQQKKHHSSNQQKKTDRASKASRAPAVSRQTRYSFALTIFLGAFLLFQVQPLISKAILPWYGGSPSVWTTSMLFFQIALLAGYCYAHGITSYLSSRAQVITHVCLVAVAIGFLPILPTLESSPDAEANPTWNVMSTLLRCIGVPFFVLATTAPLMQAWWHRLSQSAPYRLYAVSNTGSLLALLTYPFLIEPNLGLRSQSFVWSAMFVVFAAVIALLGTFVWRQARSGEIENKAAAKDQTRKHDVANSTDDPPTWKQVLGWIVLSSCGSVLLLAMTNHLSQNVAVVPFVWVAPLAIYLLSFILTFSDFSIYRRRIFGGLMFLSQLFCAFLYHRAFVDHVFLLFSIHLLAMFAGSMVCHGELFQLKPNARHLTWFYLVIAAGGAAGGLFVALIAPVIFLRFYEYPLVFVACWLIWFVCEFRDQTTRQNRVTSYVFWAVSIVLFAVMVAKLRDGVVSRTDATYVSRRGFFGVLSVQQQMDYDGTEPWLSLMHGTIRHGAQYLSKTREFEPTTYYGSNTGLGHALDITADLENRRIGLLGLGIGTVVSHCRPGDTFRVYEINPDVVEIATDPNIFTFWTLLQRRNANGNIILGDARLSLRRELERGNKWGFDLLIVDTFNGDAIPVHLLTREAFALYFAHLSDNGILVVHITNRHLDLLPVVRTLASHFEIDLAYVHGFDPVNEWALLAKPHILDAMAVRFPGEIKSVSEEIGTKLWTDDFSDIFSVIK